MCDDLVTDESTGSRDTRVRSTLRWSNNIKHGCHCSTLYYTSSHSPKQWFLAFKIDGIFRCERLTLDPVHARTYPFVLNMVCRRRSLITRCKSCEPKQPTTSLCNKLASVSSTAHYNEAGSGIAMLTSCHIQQLIFDVPDTSGSENSKWSHFFNV